MKLAMTYAICRSSYRDVGRTVVLAVCALMASIWATHDVAAQNDQYSGLDREIKAALERQRFSQEFTHDVVLHRRDYDLALRRNRTWFEQVGEDPWWMMLFANGQVSVESRSEAPYVGWRIGQSVAGRLLRGASDNDKTVYIVRIARREMGDITYRNQWKDGPYEMRSVRFNYFLVPFWTELKNAGPFDGLVVLRREPSTGDWIPSEVRLPDKGSSELEGQARAIMMANAGRFQNEIATAAANGRADGTKQVEAQLSRVDDNVVRDRATNLAWAGPHRDVRAARDTNPWNKNETQRVASEICSNGKFAGQDGWKLPTKDQLGTIVDRRNGRLRDTEDNKIWGPTVARMFDSAESNFITSEAAGSPEYVWIWRSGPREFHSTEVRWFRGLGLCVHDKLAGATDGGRSVGQTTPSAAPASETAIAPGPIPNQTAAAGTHRDFAKMFFAMGGDKLGDYKLGGTVIVSTYALQPWVAGPTAGEAIFEFVGPPIHWTLKTMGGGAADVGGLVAMGIPKAIAEQLVAGLGRTVAAAASPSPQPAKGQSAPGEWSVQPMLAKESNPTKCAGTIAVKIVLRGNELTGTTSTGNAFTATVNDDGSFKTSYVTQQGGLRMDIDGNVRQSPRIINFARTNIRCRWYAQF